MNENISDLRLADLRLFSYLLLVLFHPCVCSSGIDGLKVGQTQMTRALLRSITHAQSFERSSDVRIVTIDDVTSEGLLNPPTDFADVAVGKCVCQPLEEAPFDRQHAYNHKI